MTSQDTWMLEGAKLMAPWIGPLLAAMAAYRLGVQRTRLDDHRAVTRQAIDRLYKPLSDYVEACAHPTYGVEGFDEDQVAQIAQLLGNQGDLLDPEMDRWRWYFQEARNYAQDMTKDEGQAFVGALAYRYHTARKSLGLPYDRSKLKIRGWPVRP